MALANELIIPVALWGSEAPTHCVSCIHITDDQRTLVTGCNDGHVCLWDVDVADINDLKQDSVTPRCMLFGHSAAILCLTSGKLPADSHILVSSSAAG